MPTEAHRELLAAELLDGAGEPLRDLPFSRDLHLLLGRGHPPPR